MLRESLLLLCTVLVIAPFVPLRWSLLAWIVSAHLDMITSTHVASQSVGLVNMLRVLGLPTVLLIRTKGADLLSIGHSLLFQAWLMFCIYVSACVLSAPNQLAALKFVGFLTAYTIAVSLFCYMYRTDKGYFLRVIQISIVIAIAIGIIQSFGSEQTFSTSKYDVWRFSSYSSNQYFALFSVLMLAILLAHGSFKDKKSLLLSAALILVLILTGSRTGMVSMIIVILGRIGYTFFFSKRIRLRTMLLSFLLLSIGYSVLLFPQIIPSQINTVIANNRAFQVIGLLTGQLKQEDIGTAQARIVIYEKVQHAISQRTPTEQIFGSGTSSGGSLLGTSDPNRAMHNEFLRAFYEWGIFGAVFFCLFVMIVIISSLNLVLSSTEITDYMLFVGLLAVLPFLFVENILPASNSSGGMAVSLLLGMLAALSTKESNTLITPASSTDANDDFSGERLAPGIRQSA